MRAAIKKVSETGANAVKVSEITLARESYVKLEQLY